MFAEVGSKGRISDGGVFTNSVLWEKICSETLNLPPPNSLPGSDIIAQYVFLGDGAFALSEHVMKPFPGFHALGTPERFFNQRLSNSRVVVENAFGILASKFRIFKTTIPLCPVKASVITMTCVLLHNFLRKSMTSRGIYNPPGYVDTYDVNGELINPGSWRTMQKDGLVPLQPVARRAANNAIETRLNFMNYLNDQRNALNRRNPNPM